MRRLALAGAVLFLVSCGGSGSNTSLTFVATNNVVGRATLVLTCDPAGGTFPDPGAACRALAREPELLSHPQPFTCAGGVFSWWDITIAGRFRGKHVDVKTSTCWTPQMHLLAALRIGRWPVPGLDPLTRTAYMGSGIELGELADTVQVPQSIPGFVVRQARLMARELGDPHPRALSISGKGPFTVRLEGSFTCAKGCPHLGSVPPSGTVAVITVAARTPTVESLSFSR